MQKSVLKVFITRNVHKRGQRFDFVRYTKVDNEVELEKRLDVIWIHNMKIYEICLSHLS